MLINNNHLTELNSANQSIQCRVELLKGSTLEKVCTCHDILSELAIERTGESKFFGFGICQKLRVALIDIDRELSITKENTLDVAFGVNGEYIYPFPRFYIQEIDRDETTNMLNITAYDILYKAEEFKFSDLGASAPYTIRTIALACANKLGVPIVYKNVDSITFDTRFPEGANFDDTESLRYTLNAIAETTQTIYYINNNWELTFQRLDKDAALAHTVDKAGYWELISRENRTITNIAYANDLEDNVSTEKGDSTGITQFVRNNPFWDLRGDMDDLLNWALSNVAGLTINQFEATWTGNYLLEIGDRIGFIGENDETISTYLLDDTITYAGTLEEFSKWQYDDNEAETFTNPVSLGEALNQTYARIDKAKKQIILNVSDMIDDNTDKINQVIVDTNGITMQVIEEYKTDIENNGVSQVKTAVGVFDDNGLTINQAGKTTSTNLNADGLVIYQGEIQTAEDGKTITNEKLLEVNNQGIIAKDLHATTYLKIGGRSRFENYESNRTGCFWIGGNG